MNASELTCGQLAENIRPYLRRHLPLLFFACFGLAGWMQLSGQAGVLEFLIIAAASLAPAFVWARQERLSLPLAPLVGLQTLIIYGTPLVVNNESVFVYPEADRLRGAFEVMFFGLSLTLAWWLTHRRLQHLRPPIHYYRFRFLGTQGSPRLVAFSLSLLGASVAFLVATMAEVFSNLPPGIYPIMRALMEAAGAGGGLLGGFLIGSRQMTPGFRALFWLLVVVHCVFTSSNFTLFPVAALVIAVSVGIFFGRGRPPVLLLCLIVGLIYFFNLSKFEMRGAHWIPGSPYAVQKLEYLPERYAEWTRRSWSSLVDSDEFLEDRKQAIPQRVSDRINNLVNLLEVQAYVVHDDIPVLGGETYGVIPALLIPRALWPDKPRTHEGMVRLNVYFGKQTLEESFVTYISWGLLPEAYGNFGPFWGALFCGVFLGVLIALLDAGSRSYPLFSLQSLVYLCMIVQLGASFEMVASVWVTSVGQMVVAIIGGSFLLVERVRLPAPAP